MNIITLDREALRNLKHHTKHRHRIELVNIILTSIKESGPTGINKTRILYETQTSTRVLGSYIQLLKNNGLINTRKPTASELSIARAIHEYFELTSKGRIFLKLYDSMDVDRNLVWSDAEQSSNEKRGFIK